MNAVDGPTPDPAERVESDAAFPLRPTVIVGVDGSERSLQAVEWASHEARRWAAELVILHATFWRAEALRLPAFEEQSRIEQRVLETARARAERAEPEVHIETILAEPPPAEALIRASERARLLVVGSRGLGGFNELLLGSVSHQCVLHAHCPVVVVRPVDASRFPPLSSVP